MVKISYTLTLNERKYKHKVSKFSSDFTADYFEFTVEEQDAKLACDELMDAVAAVRLGFEKHGKSGR